jgi:hypothetical protein
LQGPGGQNQPIFGVKSADLGRDFIPADLGPQPAPSHKLGDVIIGGLLGYLTGGQINPKYFPNPAAFRIHKEILSPQRHREHGEKKFHPAKNQKK